MSTAETLSPPLLDRRTVDQEATVLSFPLPSPSEIQEGFFEPIDPIYNTEDRNPVVDKKRLSSDSNRHGTTTIDVVTLKNGREYEVVTGQPRIQRSDIPLVSGTALGTSIRGHNWHNLYQGMDLGFPSVLIGPEGGHSNWPKNIKAAKLAVKNLVSISLEETAENVHEILDWTDQLGFYEPGAIADSGESRRAMVAMGVRARGAYFGRHVVYSDVTAPCFPIARKEITRRTNLPFETIRQTSLRGHLPLKMHPRRLLHYPATLNLNPHFLLHVVGTIPTLLGGSAGKLAKEIPQDANMHLTLFDDDTWSVPQIWDEIFAGHPNVVTTRRPGNHMAITDDRTYIERSARLAGLRDELAATHNNTARINWDNVHLAGDLALKHA
jgi:hypothetical protein